MNSSPKSSADAPVVPKERPDRLCDVVMKGGITSGVVYPHAVCELAATYRLRNVGGTSAGAIAAAAAAAAEYGRATGGYDQLAALPAWIGSDGNLSNLFQPQKETRKPYALVLAAISHTRGKPFWIALSAVRRFWLAALLGAAPGLALVALAIVSGEGGLRVAAIAAGAILAVAGAAVAVGLALKRVVTRELPRNRFGMCSGMPGHDSEHPALTPWLADLVDRAAGRPQGADAEPLTFGHLWAGPGGDVAEADPRSPWLRLEMMTTNVTNHRAERLPSASREYYFSPDEMRALFPERVVAWMLAHPVALPTEPARRRIEQLRRQQLLPLRPMPHAADLPVIVATRMSLSFPVLLSAVPLWRIDFSRTANQEATDAASTWLSANSAEWDAATHDEAAAAGLAARVPAVAAERCWFSDGGISSNFPVHFFDALLPAHPTVGLNLRPFHPDRQPSADEAENVWMATSNASGILDWWYRFDGDLAGFLGNVVRTMQNRIDDAQMRVPGYRDRIAHVSLTDTEGGMNLKMAPETISALTARGRVAGERLVERFSVAPADAGQLSWDNHRWVRLRVALLGTSELLRTFADKYAAPPAAGGTPYEQLLAGPAPPLPTSYRMDPDPRAKAVALIGEVESMLATIDAMPGSLATSTPRPTQSLRMSVDEAPLEPRGTA